MAKFNNEELFKITPLSVAQNRALTFGVYVYLQLNERVIMFKGSGSIVDDIAALQRMQSKGLKYFYVRESEREAFEAWIKGTKYEKDHLEIAARDRTEQEALANAAKGTGSTGQNAEALAPGTSTTAGDQTAAAAAATNGAGAELDEDLAAMAPRPIAQTPDEEIVSPAEQKKREEEAIQVVANTAADELMKGLLKPAPDNQPAIGEAKDMVKKILKASPAGASIADIIDNPDTEHATMVAIYSMLFTMGLGKKEPLLLQDIIIASLLHDIGMTQISCEVVAIPKLLQQPPQKKAFDTHVSLGVDLLMELDYVPGKRVLQAITQHHEKFNGTGYPEHLESFRIEEIGQVVGLADLIESIGRGYYDSASHSLNDSLHVVAQIERQSTFPEYFNPDIFKKVMNWLKKGGGQDYIAAAETAVNDAKQKLLKAG